MLLVIVECQTTPVYQHVSTSSSISAGCFSRVTPDLGCLGLSFCVFFNTGQFGYVGVSFSVCILCFPIVANFVAHTNTLLCEVTYYQWLSGALRNPCSAVRWLSGHRCPVLALGPNTLLILALYRSSACLHNVLLPFFLLIFSFLTSVSFLYLFLWK